MQHVGGVFSVYNESGEQLARAHNRIIPYAFMQSINVAMTKAAYLAPLQQRSDDCFMLAMVIGTFTDDDHDIVYLATPPLDDPGYALHLDASLVAVGGGPPTVTAPLQYTIQGSTVLLQSAFRNSTDNEATYNGVGIVLIPHHARTYAANSMRLVAWADVSGSVPVGGACIVKYELTFA